MKKNYFCFRRLLALLVMPFTLATYSVEAQMTTQTFICTSAMQTFTVPQICVSTITIEARGAQGGDNVTLTGLGGLGAKMVGEFNVVAGQVLNIIVGGKGANNTGGNANNGAGGGGGGSFVYTTGATTPMIVAGGGGGSCLINTGIPNYYGKDAALTTTATGSRSHDTFSNSPGGVNGGDGTSVCGSGGKGWTSVLSNPAGNPAGNATYGAAGGYGGGGGAATSPNPSNNSLHTAGGGGGYSGGGAGGSNYYHGGGGGGSFNAGLNQVNTASVQANDGVVIITYNQGTAINTTTSHSAICVGNSATLSASGLPTFTWSSGPNVNTIVVNPNVTTSYTVSGTNTTGCVSKAVITVTVNQLPIIIASSSHSLLCVGSTATLTAAGALTYTWNPGPASTTLAVNPIVNTTYSLAGTSTAGCINTGMVSVDVNTITISVTPNSTLCTGKDFTLSASGATAYSWSSGGPFQSITIHPLTTTGYTVTATDVNGCPQSGSVLVTVVQNPVVTASANRTVICKGEPVVLTAGGTGVTSFTWNSPAVSTNASQTIIPASDITYNYSVTGTDNNGCKSGGSVSVKVGKCTGISEVNNLTTETISVFPNPSNGDFTVQSNIDVNLKLTNELGQFVRYIQLSDTNGHKVAVTNLATGVYYITGQKDGSTYSQKVIITK